MGPFSPDGDVHGGLVAQGRLVLSGGESAMLSEQVDPAFDRVTLPVDVLVERGRTPAGRAPLEPVGMLVDRDRIVAALPCVEM